MRYAFEYCVSHGRKRLTCVTKSNIMKLTDGAFQQVNHGNELGCSQLNISYFTIFPLGRQTAS